MTDELKAALAPFLQMAKACKSLHDRETIAARAYGGRVVSLDALDFRALEFAVAQERQKAPENSNGG